MTALSPIGSLQVVLYAFQNPTSILSILGDLRGVDGFFCPGSGGRTHPHRNLMSKKIKTGRETGELKTEGENAKKPLSITFFESYFDLPNHYSNNVVIIDSDFILTERRAL